MGIETNLLTHAAKEQIRFLHNLNPLEWNCKALSECFPTTEAGVKVSLMCRALIYHNTYLPLTILQRCFDFHILNIIV